MEYTAVIRTLGKAGEKYQKLLDSLVAQTVKPKQIIVYIAEGYPIPKETVGFERYVYVKKGMVAQRALPYDEVDTEYMLCLDDDLVMPDSFVEDMFRAMAEAGADVISPDVFPNHKRSFKQEVMMALSGRMIARRCDDNWGYSYRKHIQKSAYQSQTNAGACFLCRKTDFQKIHFEDEIWLDAATYPLGEDQVMYFKMHLLGLKVFTFYDSGIIHLDAGDNLNPEKQMGLLYSDLRFKVVFWHRFLWSVDNAWGKLLDSIAIAYYLLFTICISALKLQRDVLSVKYKAIKDTFRFLKSDEYKRIPKMKRV